MKWPATTWIILFCLISQQASAVISVLPSLFLESDTPTSCHSNIFDDFQQSESHIGAASELPDVDENCCDPACQCYVQCSPSPLPLQLLGIENHYRISCLDAYQFQLSASHLVGPFRPPILA